MSTTSTVVSAVVSNLDRTACLAILADAPESVLRGAVAALLSGAPVTAPPATETPAKAKGAAKARPVAAPAATGGKVAPADAIAALAPEGFSKGELAELTGEDPKSSALNTAIKHALAEKTIVAFGERRFLRYGATLAVAKARNAADRGK